MEPLIKYKEYEKETLTFQQKYDLLENIVKLMRIVPIFYDVKSYLSISAKNPESSDDNVIALIRYGISLPESMDVTAKVKELVLNSTLSLMNLNANALFSYPQKGPRKLFIATSKNFLCFSEHKGKIACNMSLATKNNKLILIDNQMMDKKKMLYEC